MPRGIRRSRGPKPAVALAVIAVVLLGGLAASAQRRTGPPVGRAVPRSPAPQAAPLDAERAGAFLEADRRHLSYLPGEVLVKFKPGTTDAGRQRALRALRSRPTVDRLTWRGDVARLVDPAEPDAPLLAARLASQPEVEFAQPNYIRRFPREALARVRPMRAGATPAGFPDDPDYRDLQWNFSLLDMPAAWDINPGGLSSVIVAVIDTGLTTDPVTLTRPLWTGQRIETVALPFTTNPDLSTSRIVAPRDFAFEPGSRVLDFDGHGTHVAATIGEDANNQNSLAGMAYRTRIMPVKVCVSFWEILLARSATGTPGYVPSDAGGCSTEDIAAGIRYAADNGARVINLSLGGQDPSPIERDAILYAISKGAFVAASMGNGFEQGNPTEFPAAYAPSIDGLMSVGAISKSRARARYSSTGSHIEIVAPGGDSHDGGGEDEGFVWQVTLFPPDQDVFTSPRPRFDRYVEVGYTGTSMATAHVSAMAALLVSQGITRPQAIEAVIKATAADLGTAGWDDQFGYGLIQPRAGLFGLGIAR